MPWLLNDRELLRHVSREVGARDRAEILTSEVAVFGDWVLAHRQQVLPLEAVLPVDPLVPGLIQRQAEHTLKIVGVVAATGGVASPPGEQFLWAVVKTEVIHEARAIQVGVGAGL